MRFSCVYGGGGFVCVCVRVDNKEQVLHSERNLGIDITALTAKEMVKIGNTRRLQSITIMTYVSWSQGSICGNES